MNEHFPKTYCSRYLYLSKQDFNSNLCILGWFIKISLGIPFGNILLSLIWKFPDQISQVVMTFCFQPLFINQTNVESANKIWRLFERFCSSAKIDAVSNWWEEWGQMEPLWFWRFSRWCPKSLYSLNLCMFCGQMSYQHIVRE